LSTGRAERVFHLAIPCDDLDTAREFYVNGLGCRFARAKEDRITLDFFGAQVVCHLCPDDIDTDPEMYPRHFGMTFQNRVDFDRMLEQARAAGLNFFRQPFKRFEGCDDEHVAFFLRDPANNLVEFKYYQNPELMY
jgi:extradiol dioxygenase family protein